MQGFHRQAPLDSRPRRPGPVPRAGGGVPPHYRPYLRMLPEEDGVAIFDLPGYQIRIFSETENGDMMGNGPRPVPREGGRGGRVGRGGGEGRGGEGGREGRERVATSNLHLPHFLSLSEGVAIVDLANHQDGNFSETGDAEGNVASGLSGESLTSCLETRNYKEGTANTDEDCCFMCQKSYSDEESIGVLHCRHECHADCLKKWLRMKNSCPICRAPASAFP